jgi:7-keto-8-aminopelargonate synthetase-like enzyme
MNKYKNIKKMIQLGEPSWETAKQVGLIDLAVDYETAPELSHQGHHFISMCSCSYLGLDTHPTILEGAIEGIRRVKSLHLTTARLRIYITYLQELEEALSAHFACEATAYVTCSAATASYLPLMASGMLTGGKKPQMIFDKYAHFSMHHVKPICGDETEVLTCEHNDIDFIEAQCKKNQTVVYVGDGTYSVAGHTPINALRELQERYGLHLFLDDSHGLSITGKLGEGFVREHIPDLGDRTVVVASLAKAFGTCGGMLMSGQASIKDLLVRYGNSWSQYINSAGIGGVLASLKIHQSNELAERQRAWRNNLEKLDHYFVTQNSGTTSPIRVLLLKSPDRAIAIAKQLFERGYYTSAVFFPTVPRNKAGLRVMPRADVSSVQMDTFCKTVYETCHDELLERDESSVAQLCA